MSPESLLVLLWTAAGVAFVHTALGVDHVVPFVAIGRAKRWPLARTLAVTAVCGVGHVASSVLLGLAGVMFGTALESLADIEQTRGLLSIQLLIGFGLAYAAWAAVKLARGDGHEHHHHDGLGGWTLFLIFVFGPCEALIPLMMVPAAHRDLAGTALLVLLFGAVTIGTMTALVAMASLGLARLQLDGLERYVHVAAGLLIAASGGAVWWLGL